MATIRSLSWIQRSRMEARQVELQRLPVIVPSSSDIQTAVSVPANKRPLRTGIFTHGIDRRIAGQSGRDRPPRSHRRRACGRGRKDEDR